jgi:hypothetical protein
MSLESNEKVVVISSSSGLKNVPLFCPICEFPMKTRDDGLSFRKVGCCLKCDNRWTSTPGVDWKSQKTPNKNSVEWKDYIEERLKCDKTIINLK